MDRWLAISDGANAALHALALCTARGGLVSAKAVAEELGVSPTYLSKLLQTLGKAGIVESTRGASGGFSLAREAARLSCLDVVLAIDGELPDRSCLFPEATCAKGSCALKVLCVEVAKKARKALEDTSVLALSKSYDS